MSKVLTFSKKLTTQAALLVISVVNQFNVIVKRVPMHRDEFHMALTRNYNHMKCLVELKEGLHLKQILLV